MNAAEHRKAWARRYIAMAPDAPLYGSEEWAALPDGPAKIAAAAKAAESLLTLEEDVRERLRAELEYEALEAKRAEDSAYVAQRDAHRAYWSGRSWRPHPANRIAQTGGESWDLEPLEDVPTRRAS